MSVILLSPSASSTLVALQSALKECGPGSRKADATEKALDYTIRQASSSKPAAFLHHDVLRTAYGKVARATRRADSVREGMLTLVRSGSNTGRVGGVAVIETQSPEVAVEARDLHSQMQAIVQRELGAPGVAVFNAMVDELEVNEAASALGMSAATVKRYRSRIRVCLAPFNSDGRVAA